MQIHTEREMARKLCVAKAWLRREAAAGRIPSLKADGRYLFNAEAVERVLADRAANETVTSAE